MVNKGIKFGIVFLLFLILISSFAFADFTTDNQLWATLQDGEVSSFDVYGGVTGVEGGFDFNSASNGYVDTSASLGLDYSISINFSTISSGQLESIFTTVANATGRDGLNFGIGTDNKIYLEVWAGNSQTVEIKNVGTTFNDGIEHNLLIKRFNSNNSIYVYLDDILIGSDTSATQSTNDRNILFGRIRADSTSNDFSGNIYEVNIETTSGTPIFYANFDSLYDQSNNSNSLSAYNGVTYNATTDSYDFDNSDDFLVAPSDDFTNITISGWITADTIVSTLTDTIFQYQYGTAPNRKIVRLDLMESNEIGYAVLTEGGTNYRYRTNDNSISTGTEYFVTITREGNDDAKVYVNGVLKTTSTSQTQSDTTADNSQFHIGYSGFATRPNYFDGKISGVSIYNRTLSSTEIAQLYSEGRDYNPYGLNYDEFYITNLTSRYYLNDSNYNAEVNESNGIFDSWGSNNGQLYGKTFNHGTNNGATLMNHIGDMEKFGGYYEFDRAEQDSIRPTINFVNEGIITNKVTMSAWVYPRSNIFGASVGGQLRSAGAGSDMWGLYQGSVGQYIFRIDNGTIQKTASGSTLSTNQWYYITGTYDGNEVCIFYNGIEEFCEDVISGNINNLTNAPFTIGNRVSTLSQVTGYNGSIDEVKIWNRALNETEIQEEMNSNAVANPEGIVAYYDFNERSGTTVYDNNHLTTGARQNTASIDDPVFSYDKAINFDGVDDYVDIGDINSIINSNKEFSISLWNNHYYELLGSAQIFSNGMGAVVNKFTISNGFDGEIKLYVFGTFVDTNVRPNENDWINLQFIQYNDSGTFKYKLYKDSVIINSGTSGTGTGTGTFYLGSLTGSGEWYNGTIADVRIYDRALSEEEIKTLYYGLQTKNFTAQTYLTNQTISNFTINSIYGNKNSINDVIQLDVPFGNIVYDWSNSEGYYNQTNVLQNITLATDVYTVNAKSTYVTFYFDEYVYNNVLPQVKLVPTAFPTLTQAYSITGQSFSQEFIDGQFYVDVYIDGTRITRETITLTKGNNIVNLTDIGKNYVYFYDATSSNALVNSSVTLTYPSSTQLSLTTDSNGMINFTSFQSESLEYGNYNITFGGTQGYVSPITFTYNATVLPYNISYNITRANLTINVYDAITTNLISGQNISLSLIGETNNYNFSTTTGTYNTQLLIANILAEETYTLRSTTDNYEQGFTVFTLNNRTNNEINLYLLNSTESTDVTITIVNQLDNSPLEGYYVKVLVFNEITNTYLTTEIFETNFEGEVVAKIRLGDEFYRFIIENQDKVVVESTNPTYIYKTTLIIPVSVGEEVLEDYESEQGMSYSLVFNEETNNFRYIYSDSQNTASQGCLKLYRIYSNEQTLLNNTCNTGASGTILVPVTEINGTTYVAKAYIYFGSTEIYLTTQSKSYKLMNMDDSNWLFYAFLITVALAIAFIWSPSIMVSVLPLPSLMLSLLGLVPFNWGIMIVLQLIFIGFGAYLGSRG